MDISKYTSCFHDGSIFDIEHRDNEIIFVMSSAQLSDEENIDNILLSKDDYMEGKLHVEGVERIFVNDCLFNGKLQKRYDFGDIFHLKIGKNLLLLDMSWEFYINSELSDFLTIKIEAQKIWWENIPDLTDISIPTDN